MTNGITQIGTGGMTRRAPGPESLADVLERVLDKGVVIIGDVGVSILDIELLTLKIRLLIASADTARDMGIDWWTGDPFFSSEARRSEAEIESLRDRIAELEGQVQQPEQDGSKAAASPTRADGGSNEK
jgi:hypothetical protein